METRVLIRSGPNLVQPIPTPMMPHMKLITIGQLVSEIFMFESVDPRRDGRQLESHPVSSPQAFGSNELKSVGIIRKINREQINPYLKAILLFPNYPHVQNPIFHPTQYFSDSNYTLSSAPMTTHFVSHVIGIFRFILLEKNYATYSWGSYVLNVINCNFQRGMYKNHIGFPVLFSQSDYQDKLETHQVT